MIAIWMIAATLFALLLGVAAHALERALRMFGREARWPWGVALVAATAWPMVAPFAPRGVRAPATAIAASRSAARIIVGNLPPASTAWISRADAVLIVLWAVAAAFLLVRLVLAFRALSRVERAAEASVVEGRPVLVTRALGPAVFGVRRPRMLVPRWLLDLDAPLRSLVLQHEEEHCRARDPQLVLAAAIAVALMPWNPALWWIGRRMRLAAELDCDMRVLRAARDPERYGKLLLFIAQRQSQTRLAPMLAESNSHLSRRIDAMNAPRPARPALRAAAFAALAVVAISVACSRRVGNDLMAPTTTAGSALTNLAPSSGATYFEFQVDRPVTPIAGSPQPSYPDSLKRAGVEGQVLAAFVVDTTGHVVVASLKVLKATNPVFAQAVRDAIPGMLLTPATVHGRKVKQLVQQPFVFATAATNRVAPTAAPKTGITPPGTVLQFDTMIVVPRRAPGSP